MDIYTHVFILSQSPLPSRQINLELGNFQRIYFAFCVLVETSKDAIACTQGHLWLRHTANPGFFPYTFLCTFSAGYQMLPSPPWNLHLRNFVSKTALWVAEDMEDDHFYIEIKWSLGSNITIHENLLFGEKVGYYFVSYGKLRCWDLWCWEKTGQATSGGTGRAYSELSLERRTGWDFHLN